MSTTDYFSAPKMSEAAFAASGSKNHFIPDPVSTLRRIPVSQVHSAGRSAALQIAPRDTRLAAGASWEVSTGSGELQSTFIPPPISLDASPR